MSWPLSQDFNEAVQNPATAFSDPDLKAGTVTTNPMGMPLPRSGNYADVYQVTTAAGQKWAVKCFTRPTSAGLEARYAAVSQHLANANLPFTVGFNFLPQGVRIRGQWYPIVKMQWVDGFPINAFVRDNLNRASILENMLSLWVRLCRRLRETGMAHGDIQHGNVLLVPAGGNSLGLKLVDYDGMYVPALANLPSGEAGHASYQHPERGRSQYYSPDLDRFPHLVVATALRGLLVGGKALWDKYDNGDNLLFTEKDFKNPGQSKLMKELWETGDPFTVGLVGHLVLSCTKPPHQTPWLDQLMPGGQPPILTPSQERQAATVLGLTIAGATPAAAEPGLPPAPPQQPPQYYPPPGYGPPPGYAPPMPPQQPAAPHRPAPVAVKQLDFAAPSPDDDAMEFSAGKRRRPANSKANLVPAIIAGVVVLGGIVGATVMLAGKKKPEVAENKSPETVVPPVESPKDLPKDPPTEPPPVKPPVEPPPAKPPAEPPVEGKKGKLLWSRPASDNPRESGRVGRFSLDGARVISASQNAAAVNVLDARTGERVAAFREHEGPATAFPFPLPNGKVMSVAREPVMLVWDAETGRSIARAPMGNPLVGLTALRADRTGKYAVLVKDEQAHVVDLESGRDALTLTTVKAPFNLAACAIRPDGSAVLSVTPDYKLKVTALPGGRAVSERAVAGGKPDKLGIVSAWSPDGKLAAMHEFDGQRIGTRTYVVAVDTGEVVKDLPGEYQLEAAFSADGNRLVLVQHATVVSLDTATWAKVAEATFGPVPAERVTDLDVTADGARAVVTTFQRTHYLVSLGDSTGAPDPSPANTATVAKHLKEVETLDTADVNVDLARRTAVDRTGKTLFLSTNTALYPVDVLGKKATGRYAPDGQIRQIWATAGGECVLEVRKDKKTELHVVDAAGKLTGPEVVVLSPDELPKHVNVSAGGTLATVVKAGGQVALFDLKTGKSFYTIGVRQNDPPAVAAYPSADGELVVTNNGKRIQTYKLAERPRFSWIRPPGLEDMADCVVEDAAPDGKAVALKTRGTDNSSTKFLIVTFGRVQPPAAIASAATGQNVHLRFVGDSQRVVVAEDDRLTLHDAGTGKAVASVKPKNPGGTMTPVPGPGGETVVFADGKGATIYATGAGGTTAAEPPAMAAKRLPVPDAAALAAADKAMKETYAADYAKKLPADRKKLADRLYADGKESTKEAATQYVLLKEAAALAAEVADAPLAVRAADALAETFEVDGFALKLAALEKIAAGTTNTQTLRATAEAIQELVEELAEKDEYEKAVKLAALAASCYSRAAMTGPQKELEGRVAQLKKLKDAFDAVKAAAETLKAKPADKDANAQVGKFRAFAQGRWEEAFKLLAAGSDAELKKLADMELAAATDADTTDAKRGDLWRDYALKQPETDRGPALGRSKFWYAKALVSARGGPDRAAAEKGLRFMAGGTEYWPGLVTELFVPRIKKIKGQIDYTLEFAADEPEIAALKIHAVEAKWTGVIVPPAPGRYKIVADTRDNVRVTMGVKPDQRKILEALDKGISSKEGYYVFGDRPVAITVEFGGQTRKDHGLKLKWLRPGAKSEEVIPASAFFHNKLDEKLVTEK